MPPLKITAARGTSRQSRVGAEARCHQPARLNSCRVSVAGRPSSHPSLSGQPVPLSAFPCPVSAGAASRKTCRGTRRSGSNRTRRSRRSRQHPCGRSEGKPASWCLSPPRENNEFLQVRCLGRFPRANGLGQLPPIKCLGRRSALPRKLHPRLEDRDHCGCAVGLANRPADVVELVLGLCVPEGRGQDARLSLRGERKQHGATRLMLRIENAA
jgi:hypothetical protein